MTLDVTAEQRIARPPDVVAAFVMDPANDTRWIGERYQSCEIG